MKINILFSLFFISLFSNHNLYPFITKKVIMGAIQFPKSVKQAQPMRIYCDGKIIPAEISNESKRIVFSISKDKYQSYFYLLVVSAEHLTIESEDNTIKWLKLKPHSPYKFYTLEYVLKNGDTSWIIKEATLPPETQIPDEAIIICYDPSYIAELSGGSAIEFPSVMIKDDILALVGSEDALHEQSSKLLLSSLDYDALHETISYSIKQELQLKTIIALER